VPFVVGIDHYLPAAFGKIHPKWKTPWVSILVQAIISAAILLGFGISEKTKTAYGILINATIILYFLPFLYMYAAVIKLASRPDRATTPNSILVPGGKVGVWFVGVLSFVFTVVAMIVSVFPPGDIREAGRVLSYEIKLCGSAVIAILIGLFLYWTARRKLARAAGQTDAKKV